MYWQQRSSLAPVAGNARNIYIKFDYSAFDATAYVMQQTTDTSVSNCGINQLMVPRTYSECDSLPGRYAIGCSPIWVPELSRPITDFTVFPSPSQSNINISFTSNQSVTGDLAIFDIFGKKLFTEKIRPTIGTNSVILDISNLRAGVYCVGISNGEGNMFFKFIKE